MSWVEFKIKTGDANVLTLDHTPSYVGDHEDHLVGDAAPSP